jgi:hypothetical protein
MFKKYQIKNSEFIDLPHLIIVTKTCAQNACCQLTPKNQSDGVICQDILPLFIYYQKVSSEYK